AASRGPWHHLLRGLWPQRNHGRHAHQSARAREEAVSRHPDLRRRLARHRPDDARGAARGRGGGDRHARTAAVPRLLEQARGARAFLEIDGRRFLRTGDLGRVDEDGYFFMVDRLKRMINAAGFKVWPSEVETLMYQHPAVLEACVIGVRDAHRGETVKALVVLREEWRGRLDRAALLARGRQTIAAYK